MSGMPMPEWYGEAKEAEINLQEESSSSSTIRPVELEREDSYPDFFAAYGVKGKDVILQFFPRSGMEDVWTDGHYINRCRSCRSEVPMPRRSSELKKCPRCGHMGLIYIPGRVEEKTSIVFPANMRSLIKKAVDVVWLGDVAIEEVPELGSYVAQLQSASNTAAVVGVEKFVDNIFGKLHSLLG